MNNNTELFAKGIVIGLSVAAPIGPMALICIRRTLLLGMKPGLVAGSGVALGDASFAAVAAFGLTAISEFLLDHETAIRLVGGLFLVYLGMRAYASASQSALQNGSATDQGNLRAATMTLGLTLTNPMTILSFVAIFAGFGATNIDSTIQALILVLGVFLGSMLWWLCLTGVVATLRQRFSPKTIFWLNRVAGAVILIFGIAAIASALR